MDLEIQVKQEVPHYADFPEELNFLIQELKADIQGIMFSLQMGEIDPIVWQAEFERFLIRYHQAAYMVGQRAPDMTNLDFRNVEGYVGVQLEFLDNFRFVIQSAEEFVNGWMARAEMYASGIKKSYWKGFTKVLPLPAMPAEGTQCLENCGCAWEIDEIDEDKGDYDAYWVRGKRDSCQTCLERAAQWSPLEIRGGDLTIPGRFLG